VGVRLGARDDGRVVLGRGPHERDRPAQVEVQLAVAAVLDAHVAVYVDADDAARLHSRFFFSGRS